MKYRLILIAGFLVVVLTGCFQETAENFSTFQVQLPIYARHSYVDKEAPAKDRDFTTLYEYKEYDENKSRIDKAELYQFSYWIDELNIEDGSSNGRIFDPEKIEDDGKLQLTYVKFYVQFARLKTGFYNEKDLDSSHFEPDPSQPKLLLAEYKNPYLKDYYKTPKNIIDVNDEIGKKLEKMLKEKPYFYFIDEWGPVVGYENSKYTFPYVESRFDLVIRLGVKL